MISMLNPTSFMRAYSVFKNSQERINSPTSVSEPFDFMSPVQEVSVEKKTKTVNFDPIAKVVLIPTRHEYYAYGCGNDIWSTQKELMDYRNNAIQELGVFMKNNPGLLPKDALKQMNNQLDDEEIEESNCLALIR